MRENGPKVKHNDHLWSVKSHHPIAATWSISPSRKRSNPQQWHHRRVQEEEVRRCFATVSWRVDINSGKRERSEAKISYCVNPNSSNQSLHLRAIQGHSGDNAIDLASQDNVLLTKGFTEYIYHVGNASELYSIIRNVLLPGGKSSKRGRQAVFFTAVNPMEDVFGMRETPCELTKPRIAPYKNTWKRLQNTVFWCNVKLAQETSLQFYQTRSHAVVLCNTLPAACIEKAVCVKKSRWALPEVRFTPRVPQVVQKSNSQHGPQDPHCQDARSSWEPTSDSKSYGSSFCRRAAEYTAREQSRGWSRSLRTTSTVNPSFRTWARRRRSTSSAKNRRTWSPTWTTPRSSNFATLLPNSNAYWEIGIIYCGCGRNMKSTRSQTEFDKNNRDVTPIPGNVIKKNSSRGAKHGPSDRQKMYYQEKQMLKKARQGKHGCHPTILLRWYADEEYRKWLSAIGWKEHQIMLYDRIAVEWHIYIATRAVRIQNSKHWILTIKCRRTSATTQSTTRLCSSEKRMQPIARRALGKDPTRLQNHPSQSTSSTKKRGSVRRNRRLWPHGWP